MKKYLLALICFLFLVTAFSQTWEHLTPIKSSDRLKASFILDDTTAYMGGFFGRLVKTTDGGKSWAQVDDVTGYPISGGIWGMHFPTNSVGYIPDDAGRIYKTIDGSASWTQLYNSTSSNFYDCHFFNADTGLVCGEFGELLKTEDGGDTWDTVETGVTTRLYDFCFTSDSVGYIALRSGDILTTSDSGNTWLSLELDNTNDLYHIDFANDTLGIAVGLYGTILRTTDAGETWSEIAVSTEDRLSSVSFLDAETVLITGDYGLVLRSIDGGETFSSEVDFTPYNLWGSLHFPSGLTYVFGDRVVLESTDQANNWDYRFDGVPEAQLMRMVFTNDSTAHSVGRTAFYGNTRNAIIKTSDKGRVWHSTYESLGSSGDVTDVSFINEEEGFASAYNTIRSTSNGGSTNWNYLNEDGYFTAIHFFDSDTGLVGNTLDGIFLSTDGGNSWEEVDACGDVNHFFFLDRDTGYAATDGGSIRKTVDGGETWTALNVGVSYNLQSVFFVNDSTGYAVGDWFNGIKTTDYGATWFSVAINQFGRDVYCPDPTNPDSVYALVASGEIQKSIDGGENWTVAIPAMNNQQLWDFEFLGPYIYACGDHGDILRARITPCESITYSIDTVVCELFISPWGEELTESGVYEHSYQNASGCDSILYIDLTVNESQYVGINEEACNSFTDANGEVYTESGMYEIILESTLGCDSVITMDLSITQIETTLINMSPTLISQEENAAYQWVDCASNFSFLEDETASSYTALSNGDYAVIITKNGCIDTSECVLVNNTSIKNHGGDLFNVYPNPASGRIRIDLLVANEKPDLRIINNLGRNTNFSVIDHGKYLEIILEEKGIFYILFTSDEVFYDPIKLINY
jgi:photosystem II stability/assembly factor-like uncharacterized protein